MFAPARLLVKLTTLGKLHRDDEIILGLQKLRRQQPRDALVVEAGEDPDLRPDGGQVLLRPLISPPQLVLVDKLESDRRPWWPEIVLLL